jgi:translation initiation factor IF-1
MKKILIALTSAFLIAGQLFASVAAAPLKANSPTLSGASTNSYPYARVTLSATRGVEGDDITVTVSGFPANADIDYRVGEQGESYSVAYDGKTSSSGTDSQVITLPSEADNGEYWVVRVITTGSANVIDVLSHTIYIGATSSSTSTTTNSGSARVSLSSTRGVAGDDIAVTVSGFPANADIDYRVKEQGESYSVAYDGKTSSSGTDSQVITLPADADKGEYWVVQVITTGQKKVIDVESHIIYIGTTSGTSTTNSGSARVSLSTTQGKSGDKVTVTVSGFPANADIDYRIGEKGETYSVAYDGKTSSSGATSKEITLPSAANKGEYWVVMVLTTELKSVTKVTSHTIYINK